MTRGQDLYGAGVPLKPPPLLQFAPHEWGRTEEDPVVSLVEFIVGLGESFVLCR